MDLRHSGQPGWNEAAWDAFVQRHPHGHILQMSGWGRLKRAFGWQDVRLALCEGDTLQAGAQLLLRRHPRLPFLPAVAAYAPKGPLVDWQDEAQVRTLLQALRRFCRRRGVLLLRIEPEIPDDPTLAARLRRLGFRPSRSVQPRTTVWVDLEADDETLLARMHSKWRYNVRLAARKGVTVREGGADDLATFTTLMAITGQRQGFGVHEPAYYRLFWELFAPTGHAVLLLAEHEGHALAGLLIGQAAGRAWYLYGASGDEGRQLMPNHLLQWEAMRWARSHGCRVYDLWGVPDEVAEHPDAPIPEPATGLWGVWRFKRGFGGRVVRYLGAWDGWVVMGG
ncbi:MAG: peptidoglycan bridge formation glycyltransferase FemA/FemB family protein [Caldilineales bacterium]|nr:peptidoglycan bridge formation glycyltransferase FemA/FemB family protein [Caldilineales bacterium]